MSWVGPNTRNKHFRDLSRAGYLAAAAGKEEKDCPHVAKNYYGTQRRKYWLEGFKQYKAERSGTDDAQAGV